MSEFDFIDDYSEPQANLETLSDNVAESAINVAFIGVGGVRSVTDAYTKILLGADLVQLYSSLALSGPHIANQINTNLAELCSGEGLFELSEVRGSFNSFDKAHRHALHAVKTHLKPK